MAWTDAEDARVNAVERALNTLRRAVLNVTTKREFRQLLLIRQQEIEDLRTRVATLETQVALLQQSNT